MKAQAVLAGLLAITGCKKTENNGASNTKVSAAIAPLKIEAPFDLKTPPADATRRPSGLIYKTVTAAPGNPAPKRNDTVMIRYTGWRQASGESFFSNIKEEKPMPLNLSTTARGFTEAMQLVRKGEKAMLWLPPEIGLKDQPSAGKPPGETLVYLVEVVDIVEAPPVPPDVATPPADARTTLSGVKLVSVRPGTGKEKARMFDEVTFNLTAWDAEGRMFDTTEMNKKPAAKVPPFRQAAPMEEVLTSMVAGERVRFWVDAAKMVTPAAPQPNMPQGPLCYEVEILQIDKQTPPPPTPPDVAKPPAGARKTTAGVSYKVLASGKGGPKPKPADTVKVHYTGWTTDGRMFDSSVIKNEPSQFGLQGVIKGWTDAIPLMSVGDRYRLWIPEELAYKDQPNRPQGMLVFEVELIEVKEAPPSPPQGHGAPPGHGMPPGDDGHGH
jgi:FKBP-type peptidyl-prolyl cis-trans isomerase